MMPEPSSYRRRRFPGEIIRQMNADDYTQDFTVAIGLVQWRIFLDGR
jgi:hypothetical protein